MLTIALALNGSFRLCVSTDRLLAAERCNFSTVQERVIASMDPRNLSRRAARDEAADAAAAAAAFGAAQAAASPAARSRFPTTLDVDAANDIVVVDDDDVDDGSSVEATAKGTTWNKNSKSTAKTKTERPKKKTRRVLVRSPSSQPHGPRASGLCFPRGFPPLAADLVRGLLHPVPGQRLGNRGRGAFAGSNPGDGWKEVLDHPWFTACTDNSSSSSSSNAGVGAGAAAAAAATAAVPTRQPKPPQTKKSKRQRAAEQEMEERRKESAAKVEAEAKKAEAAAAAKAFREKPGRWTLLRGERVTLTDAAAKVEEAEAAAQSPVRDPGLQHHHQHHSQRKGAGGGRSRGSEGGGLWRGLRAGELAVVTSGPDADGRYTVRRLLAPPALPAYDDMTPRGFGVGGLGGLGGFGSSWSWSSPLSSPLAAPSSLFEWPLTGAAAREHQKENEALEDRELGYFHGKELQRDPHRCRAIAQRNALLQRYHQSLPAAAGVSTGAAAAGAAGNNDTDDAAHAKPSWCVPPPSLFPSWAAIEQRSVRAPYVPVAAPERASKKDSEYMSPEERKRQKEREEERKREEERTKARERMLLRRGLLLKKSAYGKGGTHHGDDPKLRAAMLERLDASARRTLLKGNYYVYYCM